ncbi:spore gernimation protein GerPD [Halalkalibacillus sediminis]|uniref:Spore gernimation protein GerPD n=2 Tax=Halalkalibacillus sediminis TaxID=2018042 RepID=A0A2I0QW24_9BACI|nr:spore gernimation protein GerPD [Halalkalibacillus sediminis]
MAINIYNDQLCVEHIQISGVSTSSLFLVGDADHLQFASTFDTPPESYIIENVVPIGPVTGG